MATAVLGLLKTSVLSGHHFIRRQFKGAEAWVLVCSKEYLEFIKTEKTEAP